MQCFRSIWIVQSLHFESPRGPARVIRVTVALNLKTVLTINQRDLSGSRCYKASKSDKTDSRRQ